MKKATITVNFDEEKTAALKLYLEQKVVKTDTYEKPISRELTMLIQKAIDYTIERYGETKYIFVNENDVSRPLQYTTIKYKVLAMIQRENEELKKRNSKLQKAVDRKDLNFIKNL